MDPDSSLIRSKINQDADLKGIIQLVSVDSKPIHDIISASKNVVLDHIPCLLTVTDQAISKFEGGAKIMEVLAEIKGNMQKEKAPAYTSLSDINLDAEDEQDGSVMLPNPMMQQQSESTDNVSPEKIKITSPVFAQPTAKKK